jgi:hypothetical protein
LWAGDRLLASGAQFAARNNAVLLSLPLGLAALGLAAFPARLTPVLLRQASAAVAVMIVTSLAWDAYATHHWSRYVGIVRGILDANRGFVEWDHALDLLPTEERHLLRRLTHAWTVSPLSFALAPKGRVKAVLGESNPRGWRPYDPRDLARIPRGRHWDTSEYREAVVENSAEADWR